MITYGENPRHNAINQQFTDRKLRVEIDEDGSSHIVGPTNRRRKAGVVGDYRRTDVFCGNTIRSNGQKKGTRNESMHVIVFLWSKWQQNEPIAFDSDKWQVDHKNGNKLDNSIGNLCLLSTVEHGRKTRNLHDSLIKDMNKIPEELLVLIKVVLRQAPFPNVNAISKMFGTTPSIILSILDREI